MALPGKCILCVYINGCAGKPYRKPWVLCIKMQLKQVSAWCGSITGSSQRLKKVEDLNSSWTPSYHLRYATLYNTHTQTQATQTCKNKLCIKP